MTAVRCATPIGFERLVAYWLGELPEADESPIEEHLFGCASCSQRLGVCAAESWGMSHRDGPPGR